MKEKVSLGIRNLDDLTYSAATFLHYHYQNYQLKKSFYETDLFKSLGKI